MSNRTDFENVASEYVEMFGTGTAHDTPEGYAEARTRLATELHNAFVAGQENAGRQPAKTGDDRPTDSVLDAELRRALERRAGQVAPGLSRGVLRLAARLAQAAFQVGECRQEPAPGDLVFDPSMIRRDLDAIGWLVAHGEAAVNDDGTGEMREVWDIRPLSGNVGPRGYQRWENAEFFALPGDIAGLVRDITA